MTPPATAFSLGEEFPVTPSHALRIDRAIDRYPLVAAELERLPREGFLFRLRKTWLGDFCYELPGVVQGIFWSVRIAVRMSGRKS